MTPEQYEHYRDSHADNRISAALLSGPDRLLLQGWNFDRETFSVRLTHNGIERSIGVVTEWASEWTADELNPGKRAQPELTDLEFATLMRDKGEHITFTRFPDQWLTTP
jgi:hypothetical protein